jgi:hypothetical protein
MEVIMSKGKNINIYLIDGDISGRIKATIQNWTGIAYKIPRNELEKCKDRDDLKQSGVYFLFGESADSGKEVVYIGQAGIRKNGEGILYRLAEHKRNSDKDYWNEAVAFTTSNNSFGATEISYLENKFCNLARAAGRYEVRNANDPTIGNVTEEKESELAEFIEYANLIMGGAFGYKVFEPFIKVKTGNGGQEKTRDLFLRMERKSAKSNVVVKAQCRMTSEGFVVLRGSIIEKIDSDTIPAIIAERRRTANIDADGVLQEDILFKSPSYAAAFVYGGNTNGRTDWKDEHGRTLKELDKEI